MNERIRLQQLANEFQELKAIQERISSILESFPESLRACSMPKDFIPDQVRKWNRDFLKRLTGSETPVEQNDSTTESVLDGISKVIKFHQESSCVIEKLIDNVARKSEREFKNRRFANSRP